MRGIQKKNINNNMKNQNNLYNSNVINQYSDINHKQDINYYKDYNNFEVNKLKIIDIILQIIII